MDNKQNDFLNLETTISNSIKEVFKTAYKWGKVSNKMKTSKEK